MKQYHNLLQTIKKQGVYKAPARENMPGTISLFGHQFRHDLSEGFPLITTKRVSFKNIVVELLWFLRGDTNIKYLVDHGCNIWNEDAYNFYLKQIGKKDGKYDIEPMSFKTFVERVKDDGNYEKSRVESSEYKLGDCGYQYGRLWRNWDSQPTWTPAGNYTTSIDQVSNLIEGLKNNPMSRRHIITAWNPATLNRMALNACHCMVQFNCRPISLKVRHELYKKTGNMVMMDGHDIEKAYNDYYDRNNIPKYYLDCQMVQRSADVFLGVPYNIASYALLTHIIADMCNMIPGEYVHTFGDVHIYENHVDQVNEQLTREPRRLPNLKLGDNVDWTKDIDNILTCIELLPEEAVLGSLFKLENYDPHPPIKAKLSTGLK